MKDYFVECPTCGHTEEIEVPPHAPAHDYLQAEKECDCEAWCTPTRLKGAA